MVCRGGYSTESMYENVGSAGDMEEILTAYVDAGMHHTIPSFKGSVSGDFPHFLPRIDINNNDVGEQCLSL
jgi:hypothetical protein